MVVIFNTDMHYQCTPIVTSFISMCFIVRGHEVTGSLWVLASMACKHYQVTVPPLSEPRRAPHLYANPINIHFDFNKIPMHDCLMQCQHTNPRKLTQNMPGSDTVYARLTTDTIELLSE